MREQLFNEPSPCLSPKMARESSSIPPFFLFPLSALPSSPSLLHYPTRRRWKSEAVDFRKATRLVVRVQLPDRNQLRMLEDVNALLSLPPSPRL